MGLLSDNSKKYYLPDITGYIKATLETTMSVPTEIEMKERFKDTVTKNLQGPVIAIQVTDHIGWSKFSGGMENAKPNDFILINENNPGNSVAISMHEYLTKYQAVKDQERIDVLQRALDIVDSNKTAENVLNSLLQGNEPKSRDDFEL